jgi:hypothetical protein
MQPLILSMAIKIDDAKFQQILNVTVGDQPISHQEIRAVIQFVQLAASIDLDDDPGERRLVHVLMHRLCAWGGFAVDSVPPLSPVPTDDEERAARIAGLTPLLITHGARDLAFVLAYLVIIVDLELAPIESALLEQLQHELAIPNARAGDLIDAIARIVTPEGSASDAGPVPEPAQRIRLDVP